ncbi:hypothetical protein AcV5_002322 [Taiwanofungus camphoratus]|nr:hypothetical protein AcV5_002322 [Antrodia cinnamomea]
MWRAGGACVCEWRMREGRCLSWSPARCQTGQRFASVSTEQQLLPSIARLGMGRAAAFGVVMADLGRPSLRVGVLACLSSNARISMPNELDGVTPRVHSCPSSSRVSHAAGPFSASSHVTGLSVRLRRCLCVRSLSPHLRSIEPPSGSCHRRASPRTLRTRVERS